MKIIVQELQPLYLKNWNIYKTTEIVFWISGFGLIHITLGIWLPHISYCCLLKVVTNTSLNTVNINVSIVSPVLFSASRMAMSSRTTDSLRPFWLAANKTSWRVDASLGWRAASSTRNMGTTLVERFKRTFAQRMGLGEWESFILLHNRNRHENRQLEFCTVFPRYHNN